MNKNGTYKVVDLFGNEETRLIQTGNKKPDLFADYDSFVEKFEDKKTTDDCYTPKAVYDVVLNYVREKCNIEGAEIIRPFYPNGDYEAIDYTENSVVIDNPPFSIITKIARVYIERNIRFFLFAPHLTLLSSDINCTAIVAGGDIIYENGATVKTSFLSNLFGDIKILAAPALYAQLQRINELNKVNLPKYDYPDNIVTVSMVQKMVENGVDFEIHKHEGKHCRGLDSQKKHKKVIFGSGYLLSSDATERKAAAERAAAERAAAAKTNSIIWELSDREKQIIKELDNRTE